MYKTRFFFLFAALYFILNPARVKAEVFEFEAKSTLTVIELNKNDEIKYELASGRIVHLKLLESKAEIIFSTLDLPAKGTNRDASIFKMECLFQIDGQEMKMIRYVPAQESFYEPYNVNGLRIWFDAVKSLNQFYNENHGECLPKNDVRIAVHDATLSICDEEIVDWCPLPNNYPDVGLSYRGEDTWLGTYFGTDLHGGLDINMPSNTPLWAPISLDYHYFFTTLKAGHNNNRWKAIKHWENGDTWTLHSSHLNELLVPEFQNITKKTKYAYTAGTLSGAHTHTHFTFRVKQPGYDEYFVDPWIIFWQILEHRKERSGVLKAKITPLAPGETGDRLQFDGTKSNPGLMSSEIEYYWSFGDGSFSVGQRPMHIYQQPGIYPVTLTIFDGVSYSSTTQHITISGEPVILPELRITQQSNMSFHVRHTWELDTYNNPQTLLPNTVNFHMSHRTKDDIPSQKITLEFINSEGFSEHRYAERIETIYVHGNNWLDLDIEKDSVNNLINVTLKPQVKNLNTQEGRSVAFLLVNDNGFVNAPYLVRVVVNFYRTKKGSVIVVDDQDEECIKSNYSWLTSKLNLPWAKYHGESFLLFSNNKEDGAVRYLPKLEKGEYRVSLYSPLYSEDVITSQIEGFYVNVSHANGVERIWIKPSESTNVGEFSFEEANGYVEISSKEAKGLVIADAVLFEKMNN
ncbi:PKD domain-containing protein [Sphingobacterium haloxyli]|nr:PKD domain-containing protein [Sphingobacterium haloxyli]